LVVTIASLQNIIPFIPLEIVIAGTTKQGIFPGLSRENVIPFATVQRIVAVATLQFVIAGRKR